MNIIRDILSSRNFDNIFLNVPKGYKISNKTGKILDSKKINATMLTVVIYYCALVILMVLSTSGTWLEYE